MVTNLSGYSELAKQADGIIGLDLLTRSAKFSIDFEKGLLTFYRPLDGASDDAPASKCFVIPLVVQGFPIHLVVDTGVQGIVLYRDHLRKGLPLMRTEGPSINVKTGRVHATQVRLPGVRIAGPEVVASVLLIEGPAGDALHEVDGYIGPAALQAKRVTFDFHKGIFS